MSAFGDQFGFAAESVWGTIVTPDHFVPLMGSESLEFNPSWGGSQSIVAGSYGEPVSRAKIIRKEAAGDVPLELSYSKLGLLLKQLMGSSATPALVSGSVYKQIHQIGTTDAKSLTLQVGRNEVGTGTVKPFTYPGAKIVTGTIAVSDGDTGPAQFTISTNAKDELTSTSLAVAAFASGASAGAFAFPDVTAVKLGGTASTSTGVISVASGVQATSLLKSLSLTIASSADTARFGLGNQGSKSEQVNNGQPVITGSFGGEFTSQSEIYDVYKAQTTIPLQITFQGALITGSLYYLFDVILPAVKITKAAPHVSGYDPTPQTVEFKAYRDDVNSNNMAQITYQNLESSL